jgi:uncharacterized coiled-coil protein SlyX
LNRSDGSTEGGIGFGGGEKRHVKRKGGVSVMVATKDQLEQLIVLQEKRIVALEQTVASLEEMIAIQRRLLQRVAAQAAQAAQVAAVV